MTNDSELTDFSAAYAATRDELVEQLRTLTPEQAATMVPACPGWSAKDVVAHVAGLVADLLAGKRPPIGEPEMTARQVAERADLSLGEVCDEWQNNAAGIRELMTEIPMLGMGLTADLTVHQGDIAEVVSAISPPPSAAVSVSCQRYVPLLQERVAERSDIALNVTLDGHMWEASAGATVVSLTGTRVDFVRALTGRRTRAEVEQTLTWSSDPIAILDDAFLQYGGYRT